MPVKAVFAPHLGGPVKFGRIRPKQEHLNKVLKLSAYLIHAALPPPPASVSYGAAAAKALGLIMKNDVLGCCEIAKDGHMIGVNTANAGDPFIYSDAQIIADYSAACGYVPGDSTTDNGCDPVAVAKYRVSHGYADGSKAVGYLSIDARNENEVKQALYLFESLGLGCELPDAWTNPMPSASGFTWDAAGDPDPEQGHAFLAFGYAAAGLNIDTWGLLGTLTWAALAKYCAESANGNVFAYLNEDALMKAQQKAPNGLNWPALIADFNALGGNIPVPNPNPPSPPPVNPPDPPPPVVTLPGITWDSAKQVVIIPPGWTASTHYFFSGIYVYDAENRVSLPMGWTAQVQG